MNGRPMDSELIVTLTVNPALDISASTAQVRSELKLRCSTSRLDPGGGGVNVSRVVRRLGGRTIAVYSAGGPIGDAYRRLIEAEGVPALVVPIRGSTRESFTVSEESSGNQYRFVLGGPELSNTEWCSCLNFATQAMTRGGFVVASGSLPPGVPDDFYARIVRLARERGGRCIIDASGPALAEALKEGTFLVSPSRRELGSLFDAELDSEQKQIDAASTLIAKGWTEYVALTLGSDGAILISKDRTIRLPSPMVEVVSTVGAGDSFLAALVLRLAQGKPIEDAFRAGVAAGAAAVMRPGTELCHRADVERLEAGLLPGTNAG